jgi:hypothetical protein
MLVTILVVGLLICFLAPLIVRRRERTRRIDCQRRQLAVARAIREYEAAQLRFPGYRNLQATDRVGKPRPTGWVFPILPYLGPPAADEKRERSGDGSGGLEAGDRAVDRSPDLPYGSLFAEYGPHGPDGKRGARPTCHIPELLCPAGAAPDPPTESNRCFWVANAGMPDAASDDNWPPDWPANGVFLDAFGRVEQDHDGRVSVPYIEQHDGLANTLLISENLDSGEWTDDTEARVGFVWRPQPEPGASETADRLLHINQFAGQGDGSIRFARPSSFHGGGVNVVFADRKTQFLNEQIDYVVFARLMMCNSHNTKFPGTDRPVPPPYRVVESEPTTAKPGPRP